MGKKKETSIYIYALQTNKRAIWKTLDNDKSQSNLHFLTLVPPLESVFIVIWGIVDIWITS